MLKLSLVFGCFICLSKSEAPYPPSGYRPQGRQFELPRNFGGNPDLQSKNQYGAPEPPPNQYLPVEPSPSRRFNNLDRQQNNLQPESQYGTPDQYRPSHSSTEGRFNNFEGQNDRNLQPPLPIQRQIPSQYLPSEPQDTRNNFERNEENYNKLTKPQVRNLKENSKNEVKSGRQNYLPPNSTKRTRQRGYPKQTTRRPRKQNEPREEEESGNPNVAISTAVANGQYYLIQPNSVLQRVSNKEVQKEEEDLKTNGFTAKLIYQNVNPISPPFYTPFIAI